MRLFFLHYSQNAYICSVVSIIEARDKNREKKMTKQLHTKKGTGKEIARLLGVSEHTVSDAIRGKIDTDTARKIRTMAIRNYGAIEIEI